MNYFKLTRVSTVPITLLTLVSVICALELQNQQVKIAPRNLGRIRPRRSDDSDGSLAWQDIPARLDNRVISQDTEFVRRGRKKCSKNIQIQNGRRRFLEQGSLVRFRCEYGFVLFGASVAACVRGQWSEPPPVCISPGCRRPELPPGIVGRPFFGGAAIIFECFPGYQMQGDNVVVCNGLSWNASIPICNSILPPTTTTTTTTITTIVEQTASSTEAEDNWWLFHEEGTTKNRISVTEAQQQELLVENSTEDHHAINTTEDHHAINTTEDNNDKTSTVNYVKDIETTPTMATTVLPTTKIDVTENGLHIQHATRASTYLTSEQFSGEEGSSSAADTGGITITWKITNKTTPTPPTTLSDTTVSRSPQTTILTQQTNETTEVLNLKTSEKPTIGSDETQTSKMEEYHPPSSPAAPFNANSSSTTKKSLTAKPRISVHDTLNVTMMPTGKPTTFNTTSMSALLACHLTYRTRQQQRMLRKCLLHIYGYNITSTKRPRSKLSPPRGTRFSRVSVPVNKTTRFTTSTQMTTLVHQSLLPVVTVSLGVSKNSKAPSTTSPSTIPSPTRTEEYDNTIEQVLSKNKPPPISQDVEENRREFITPFKLDTHPDATSPHSDVNIFAILSSFLALALVTIMIGVLFYYYWRRNKGIARRSRYESDGRNLSVSLDMEEEFVYFGNNR